MSTEPAPTPVPAPRSAGAATVLARSRADLAAALAGLTLLMLFDPAARNQVISVLILAAVLVILSFVLPTGQRAGAQK